MSLARFQTKALPFVLLLILFSIIYFFIFTIGDPTKENIINNTGFDVSHSYLITDRDKTFSQILQQQPSFTSAQIQDTPWDFEQHAYWLKLSIANKLPKSVRLISHFNNVMLDELDIFQVDQASQIVQQKHLGDHRLDLPFVQRITPHFDFEVASEATATVYVRIATTGISNTPIHIYQLPDFQQLVKKMHLLWGLFIGVLVIIGLYNLVLYFAVKDTVYLIYNAYILSCLSLFGVVLGSGFYIFPVQMQLILHHQIIAVNCSVAIFVLLFLIYFLKINGEKPWQYRLSIGTVAITALVLFVSLWIPEYIMAKIFFILMPCIYLVCIALIISKIKSGLEWGKLYVYSWVPLLLGGAVQPLALTGVIRYSFLTHHAFMIGVLLEVVLMAMALADRMRFQKEQTIFNATHEISSGLPNLNQLESSINRLLLSKTAFSVCLVDIENYHSLTPYLEHEELQKLERHVVVNLTPILESDSRVLVISTSRGETLKIAKAKEGSLAFIFESTDQETTTRILNELQKVLRKELKISGLVINLNTKIGVSVTQQNNLRELVSAGSLIQHALLAIEQNKETGELLYFYKDLKASSIKGQFDLARDLQMAIRENQLELYHQPQINLENGTIYGSEVLLRWNHPIHGFIPPGQFVQIAEDTGLMNELTRWVIHSALMQFQQLVENQYDQHKVSINISAQDVSSPEFLTYVQAKMAEFNILPNRLIFELTESVMVSDRAVLRGLMEAFSHLGISVSIDDYGTGYSSLIYISQLKFDELKIDKAFILDLDSSERNLTIVKTTIDMAQNLNLTVVGEGVESYEIEQKLVESGCNIAQGYYYSKPLPFSQYLTWLKEYKETAA